MTQSSTLTPPRKTKNSGDFGCRWCLEFRVAWMFLSQDVSGVNLFVPKHPGSKPFALPRNRFHLFRQHDELLRVPGNIREWNNVRRRLMRVSRLDFLLMAEIQLTSCEWFRLSCGYQDFEHPGRIFLFPLHHHQHLDPLERDLKEAYGRNLQSLVDTYAMFWVNLNSEIQWKSPN